MSFLGVTASAKGFIWQQREADASAITALQHAGGLDPLHARLLAARHVSSDEIAGFLTPRLRDLMPDPSRLLGFEDLQTHLLAACAAGETIGILADYDVDGATSAALFSALFDAMDVPFVLYVPDRLTEGYGPSDAAFLHFAKAGVRTVVCVDCGSMAHGPVQRAQAAGQKVLVVDHHQLHGAPPIISAHVNPNQPGDDSGLGACAAVGVCFVVLAGLMRALKAAGKAPELDLMNLLDLVALGTVCDVVPLKGLNRAFVLQGLKVWAQTRHVGMRAMLDILPKAPKFDGTLAGFQIGPRLNAAGRVGPSNLAARLLTSQDAVTARELAGELDRLNQHRREIEGQVLAQARLALAEQEEDLPYNLVADPAWHPGVVGVVAGRLKDSTGKPSIVLGGDGSGNLTGSGRSVPGFDLGGLVLGLREAEKVISGGGHKMAAGLKLAPEQLPDIHQALRAALRNQDQMLAEAKQRKIDISLSLTAATIQLADFLSDLQPFGMGNPEPVLALADVRVSFMQGVGKNHLRLTLEAGGEKLRAIAFRAANTQLEAVLRKGKDQLVHVSGSLTRDSWTGGDAVQFIVEDAALASGT